MKKYKILFLCHYPIDKIKPKGIIYRKKNQHPASWVEGIVNSLSRNKNYEIYILTVSSYLKNSITFEYNNKTITVLRNPYSIPFTLRGFPSFLFFEKLTRYIFVKRKIRQIIKEQIKPDLIYSFGTESFYSISAINLGIPNIIHIQGPIAEYYKHAKKISQKLQIGIEKKSISETKFIFARTRFDNDFVKNINSEVKIFNVWEPVREVFFNNRWKNSKNFDILYVGMMSKELKNPELVIKSLPHLVNKYPTMKLNIIGTCSKKYMEYLISLTKKLDVEKYVNFLGFKEAEDIAKALSNHRIYILASKCENSPNSLAEAMVVGTPIIASKVGGISSMIEDGVNGFLFNNSVEELVNKLDTLFSNERLCIEFSHNATLLARDRFNSSNISKKTTEIFNNLLETKEL